MRLACFCLQSLESLTSFHLISIYSLFNIQSEYPCRKPFLPEQPQIWSSNLESSLSGSFSWFFAVLVVLQCIYIYPFLDCKYYQRICNCYFIVFQFQVLRCFLPITTLYLVSTSKHLWFHFLYIDPPISLDRKKQVQYKMYTDDT